MTPLQLSGPTIVLLVEADGGLTRIDALFCRDNILVLDVFFEALNYETIEQKKAYEVAGLLGRFPSRLRLVHSACLRWSDSRDARDDVN